MLSDEKNVKKPLILQMECGRNLMFTIILSVHYAKKDANLQKLFLKSYLNL